LFALRERLGNDAFPKSASDYLNDWANPEKGWLRKFYRQGSDEAHFDLMPATEKAIAWLGTLTERSFVGTESRLLTSFELLKQMSEGSQADPARRFAELQARRDDIDAEMARSQEGDVALLDDTAHCATASSNSCRSPANCWGFPRGRTQFPPARSPGARAHRACGKAARANCSATKSWASAMPLPIPTRGAASALSGIS
jgi:hypothetical protein